MANQDASSLSCQELIELVTDYVERMLSPADRARFESHLGVCADCHQYLDQMRQTILLVGALAEQDIPEEAKERLLYAFRSWKQQAGR
jgi:anti-sigma factor RsiW